jgi:hypothetical protein
VGWSRRIRFLVSTGLLLVIFAAPGAPAAQSRAVVLTVAIAGKGTVRLSTGRQLACASSCKREFPVRAGNRVTLTAQTGNGWKVGAWGGACRGTASTCKLRVSRAAHARVTFIPPGARANPIPLGVEGDIDGGGLFWGWGLKVLSSRLAQNHLFVQLSATAHGTALILYQLQANIFLAGRIQEYSPGARGPNPCIPPAPDFLHYLGVYLGSGDFGVLEGQTVTGYLCFQVAPIDAPFLLFTEPPTRSLNPPGVPSYPPDAEAVWFALR